MALLGHNSPPTHNLRCRPPHAQVALEKGASLVGHGRAAIDEAMALAVAVGVAIEDALSAHASHPNRLVKQVCVNVFMHACMNAFV